MVELVLNEEKLKLMTSIGMFEKKEGKKIFPVNHFFKSDYIGRHVLRSVLGFTFCWLLGTGLVVLYKAEDLLASLDFGKIEGMLGWYLWAYVLGLAVYLLITCAVYMERYEYASKGMKVYIAKLKRLEKRYELQNRNGQGGRKA